LFFPDGYHTGDLGRIDGFAASGDRPPGDHPGKNNIDPRIIEDTLLQHQAVELPPPSADGYRPERCRLRMYSRQRNSLPIYIKAFARARIPERVLRP
jgi:hypothetical protein